MMDAFLKKLSDVIRKIAEFGAGTVSMGVSYEPKLPRKLMK